ncbi:hypothetical protein BGX38DRAFT_1271133 [Terfezia claveryi]|nr:hypothetical protein BGX38DRAFT_1271133 [Terfezia claveryi]
MSKQYHKPSDFSLKRCTTSRKKEPQTADEFIGFGTDFEESGDRWRNQDNPKSSRFYMKAIAAYEAALRLAPNSLDAAYNRARLQLTIATNDHLSPPGVNYSAADMLQEALRYHEYCLNLPNGHSEHDIIFNTGQTYIALAEEVSSGANGSGSAPLMRAMELVWNGIQMFDRALALQESQLQSMVPQDVDIDLDTEDGGVTLCDSNIFEGVERAEADRPEQGERWAVIKEPVTRSDVFDTVLAKLEALILLCGLIQQTGNTKFTGDPYIFYKEQEGYLLSKLEKLLEYSPESKAEAAITRANFTVAVADLGFKSWNLSAQQYTEYVQRAFPSGTTAELGPVMIVNKAEAYIQLAQTFLDRANLNAAEVTWSQILSHFTLAAKLLAEAATQDKMNARLCCLRGDVEMFRSRIIMRNEADPKRLTTVETLWNNAGVFYRGTRRLAEASPDGQMDMKVEGIVKGIVAEMQKQLTREGCDPAEILANARKELAAFPGWGEIAVEAVRNGVFDEMILVELEK